MQPPTEKNHEPNGNHCEKEQDHLHLALAEAVVGCSPSPQQRSPRSLSLGLKSKEQVVEALKLMAGFVFSSFLDSSSPPPPNLVQEISTVTVLREDSPAMQVSKASLARAPVVHCVSFPMFRNISLIQRFRYSFPIDSFTSMEVSYSLCFCTAHSTVLIIRDCIILLLYYGGNSLELFHHNDLSPVQRY